MLVLGILCVILGGLSVWLFNMWRDAEERYGFICTLCDETEEELGKCYDEANGKDCEIFGLRCEASRLKGFLKEAEAFIDPQSVSVEFSEYLGDLYCERLKEEKAFEEFEAEAEAERSVFEDMEPFFADRI